MKLFLLTGMFTTAFLAAAPSPVRAAQSFDNCTGFIDSLPAHISQPGTWCMRKDLSTSVTEGNAITVAANNVTIDCKDFILSGLAAGAATESDGIFAYSQRNTTVRYCSIRGFRYGVFLREDCAGSLVEDNRFEQNKTSAILVYGDGSTIRRNVASHTGGSSRTSIAIGILAAGSADIIDNTINGVAPTADASGNAFAEGIRTEGNVGGSVSGNRVRNLLAAGMGAARGIYNFASKRVLVTGNEVIGENPASGTGLYCSTNDSSARDNVVNGFVTAISGCRNGGNSL